jgi:hypothetical protein
MDSHDPSGIVCDTSGDMRLKDSLYNNSNGAMTLTFESADASANHTLIVKLVEFKLQYYISIAGHIMQLNTFYNFKSAQTTPYGLSVCFDDDAYVTFRSLSSSQFMTILAAVDDAVSDANIHIDTDVCDSDTASSNTDDNTEPSMLDTLLPPPNSDTLEAPHSTPLTRADQVTFLIGIFACLIMPLYSVYLALSTIKFA